MPLSMQMLQIDSDYHAPFVVSTNYNAKAILVLVFCLQLLACLSLEVDLTTKSNQLMTTDDYDTNKSAQKHSHCDDLMKLNLENPGKYKSYEFVLNNCLVQHFLASLSNDAALSNNKNTSSTLDFNTLVHELQMNVRNNIELLHKNHEVFKTKISKDLSNGTNKIKGEVKLKSATRQLKHDKQVVENLLQMAQVRVALLETEINVLMDKCASVVLARRMSSNASPDTIIKEYSKANSDSICAESIGKTTDEVVNTCDQLRTLSALLKVSNINLRHKLDLTTKF